MMHSSMRHQSSDGEDTRLNLVADAKLLLQVRRIAIDEVVLSKSNDGGLVHPVTPTLRPRMTVTIPSDVSLNTVVSEITDTTHIREHAINTVSPTGYRCRTVSFRSQDFEDKPVCKEDASTPSRFKGGMCAENHVRPIGSSVESALEPARLPVFPKPTVEVDEDDSSSQEDKVYLDSSPGDGAVWSHKFVGESLPAGMQVRDVLRKKFSWKSFPELEAYLVDHRFKYLECSNALNYTKQQKQYNNKLTQGLLDLAAQEGYIFDGFTFAAVRDRIRCFYKSFVQASKKKKRLKICKRGRSLTL
jgi:hypothetical protein